MSEHTTNNLIQLFGNFIKINWIGLCVWCISFIVSSFCTGIVSIFFSLVFWALTLIEALIFDTILEKNYQNYNTIKIPLKIIGYVILGFTPLCCYIFITLGSDKFNWDIFIYPLIPSGLLLILVIVFELIKKTCFYKAILLVRYLFTITTILSFIGIGLIDLSISLIGAAISANDNFTNIELPSFLIGYLLISTIIFEFAIYFLLGEVWKAFRNQSILFFLRSNSILFLRSFNSDTDPTIRADLSSIIDLASVNNAKVVKIGNPKLLFSSKEQSVVYYLPTTNWKRHLNKMIKKVNTVYVSLSETEGLIWEVVAHKEYWNKYIFSISSYSTLKFWINYFENNQKTLSKALNYLADEESNFQPKFFIIRYGKLYYHTSLQFIFSSIKANSFRNLVRIEIN